MVYILLWLILGLIGYCLLAYQDVLKMLERLNDSLYLDSWRLPYTKYEMLRGMLFALILGPIAIVWYIINE